MNRGAYVCDKLPGAPSEAVADNLNTVYEGDFDYGDRSVADLESTPEVFLPDKLEKF